MRPKCKSLGWAPWLILLSAVPASFVIGCCATGAKTQSGIVPMNVPKHLLSADCVKELDIPGDDSADPVLVAGCDDAVRSAFFRTMIASTVLVSVDGFPKDSDRISYSGGTGVIVGNDGGIITAHHVIDDAVSVTVSIQELSADGQSVKKVRDVPVDVVAFSEEHDVALLRPKRKVPMPPPLPIRLTPLAKGELVWHFGKTTTWASGTVSELDHQWELEKRKIMTIGALVRGNQGDSGGPLVTAKGELVGIMLAVTNDKSTSFFLAIGEAQKALMTGICKP